MSGCVGESATDILKRWQMNRLETIHQNRVDYGQGPSCMTVLTYYWGADVALPDTQFWRIESAFRETWLRCGMVKSVIVTDKPTFEVERFAETFSNVEIQIEPTLVAGNLTPMSIDCDSRFADRFNTDYLMVIQDDGFPLREGLDEFLGKWDFIGAPYVRDKFLPRLVARMFNLWTANGGFSIRSMKMCQMAAELWRQKYCHFTGDEHWIGEDAYYTETLLKHSWRYNREMRMADNRTALRFAYDCVVNQPVKDLPFGFHRAETFAEFVNRGWLQV